MSERIDFVVTWVDGGDAEWQKDKAKYISVGTDNRNARFRDWDQLKYWFRAVEKYAPWVNKIHFVTYGHLPKWLNTTNPKLNIVNHKDFIPNEYLPVFNSTAIEVHLYRIPGLSDNFVYFNDDMYLMKHCKPTDFFKNGKPVDMPQFEPIPIHNHEMYYYHLYNDYSIYRQCFKKKEVFHSFNKYVNPKYGKIAINNLLNLLSKNLYLHSLHLPIPLAKDTMIALWEKYPEELKSTAASKFRQITNNSLEMFRGYQLITGNFYPANKKGIVLSTRDVEETRSMIQKCPYKFMCLSDNSSDVDFERHKQELNLSFEKALPERCSFER